MGQDRQPPEWCYQHKQSGGQGGADSSGGQGDAVRTGSLGMETAAVAVMMLEQRAEKTFTAMPEAGVMGTLEVGTMQLCRRGKEAKDSHHERGVGAGLAATGPCGCDTRDTTKFKHRDLLINKQELNLEHETRPDNDRANRVSI